MSLRLSIPILFVVAVLPARGATIDLAGTPARVRSSNPELKAARLAIEEARGRLRGAGRLSNPSLSVEFQGESALSPRTTGIGIDQGLPLTKRLRLERHLSSQMVEAAVLEVRDIERRRIAQAQALVIGLLALEGQRSLRQRQSALSKELADFAKEGSARGEISPLDAAQALVDGQRSLLAVRSLEAERAALLGDLRRILGVPADEELSVLGDLPPLEEPAAEGWERRPDLQSSRLREEAARTDIELARAKRWEDVTAGLFAAKESQGGAAGGRDHGDFVGFRISLPLPFWNKNEGEIEEKEAGSRRAALETEALVAEIGTEAAAAREEMAAHAGLAAEMRDTLLPAVREQAERLERAYKSGEADLLSLMRAREQQIELEAAVVDAARDFHLARVRYEEAVGLHAPAATAK